MKSKNRIVAQTPPPDAFWAKMATLLDAESFAAFQQSFTHTARVGLRVNTLKIAVADFTSKRPFVLTPVGAHEPAGFVVDEAERPGSHPYHAAGLYYLQEPAAMTVAALAAPQPGEWVLDLAAAPGGKSTHLASLLGDVGLLVANEVEANRVGMLSSNLERWGARQVVTTNSSPEKLAQVWPGVFDRVLLDAPCSGEGMFRRLGGFAWSPAMVEACARRQGQILPAAAAMVRPGGWLIYSTCTFSPEENEAVIGRFLAQFPEFALVERPLPAGAERGRPLWGGEYAHDTLSRTIRLWPHKFAGEGHFVAILQREGGDEKREKGRERRETWRVGLARAEERLWRDFVAEVLMVDFPAERLHVWNGRLYLLPPALPALSSVHITRPGLLLGELHEAYFKPAHALALSLKATEVGQTLAWSADDLAVKQYVQGQDIPVEGGNGWVLVQVEGFGLGWGKRVNGRLKNHYPRGLRQMS